MFVRVKEFLFGDEEGALAIFFGVTLIPILLILGLTVDYGQAYKVKNMLTIAADAASLAAAKAGPNSSQQDLQIIAQRVFRSNLEGSGINIDDIDLNVTFQNNANQVTVTAAMSVPNSFMTIRGFKNTDVATSVTASRTVNDLEAVLALDVTGSMGWSIDGELKIDSMKTAAKDLISYLIDENKDAGSSIQIGLVPWSYNVRLASVNSSSSTNQGNMLPFTCHNTDYENGKLKDGSSNGPVANFCPDNLMTDLSEDSSVLSTRIDALTPNGATDISAGLTWGDNMLDPSNALFGGSKADYNNPEVRKVIVLLSDGTNWGMRHGHEETKFKWKTRAEEEYGNLELTGLETYQALILNEAYANSMNGMALKRCHELKQKGVVIYTIGFGLDRDPNTSEVAKQHAKHLLKLCANTSSTTVKYYFDVNDGDDLKEAFNEIAGTMQSLRLTN